MGKYHQNKAATNPANANLPLKEEALDKIRSELPADMDLRNITCQDIHKLNKKEVKTNGNTTTNK